MAGIRPLGRRLSAFSAMARSLTAPRSIELDKHLGVLLDSSVESLVGQNNNILLVSLLGKAEGRKGKEHREGEESLGRLLHRVPFRAVGVGTPQT
jgi:hypothetical protein